MTQTPILVRATLRDEHRQVCGYALRPEFVAGPHDDAADQEDAAADPAVALAIEAAYARIASSDEAAGLTLLVEGTLGMLAGVAPVPAGPIVVEVPAWVSKRPDAEAILRSARDRGLRLALGGYRGENAQTPLLPLVEQVTVDTPHPVLAQRAHQAGASVVVRGADTVAVVEQAFATGADLVQGLLVERDAPARTEAFTADETHCLALLDAVSAVPPDIDRAVTVVVTDAELSIRVLRVVNAAATGLRTQVDSVHRAVVMVGPRQLRAIAAASLTGAGASSRHELWAMVTRALTCWRLTGEDAAYTAGLLSAVAELRRVSITMLARRAALSGEVSDALCLGAGELGRALRAVRHLEAGEVDAIGPLGWDPQQVADAWHAELPDALTVATALAHEAAVAIG